MAGCQAWRAPPDRAAVDRRREHHHCGRQRASRRCVFRVPLCDRARKADCADLEARIFRGRRSVDRRRHRRPAGRGGAVGSGPTRMRVTIRLFARLRDIAGVPELVREVPTGATAADLWRGLVEQFPAMAGYDSSISTAVNADYAKMTAVLSDNDEVAFLPPVSGG